MEDIKVGDVVESRYGDSGIVTGGPRANSDVWQSPIFRVRWSDDRVSFLSVDGEGGDWIRSTGPHHQAGGHDGS